MIVNDLGLAYLSSDEKKALRILFIQIPDFPKSIGMSHPFCRGARVQVYRRQDLGNNVPSSLDRTKWFVQQLLNISRKTGGSVPYAFKTADGEVRSLDAGCLGFLLSTEPPLIEVSTDKLGYITAVTPTPEMLRRYSQQ
jgi:hypothetical protein